MDKKRTTIYLSEETITKLKVLAIMNKTNMSNLVEMLIEQKISNINSLTK